MKKLKLGLTVFALIFIISCSKETKVDPLNRQDVTFGEQIKSAQLNLNLVLRDASFTIDQSGIDIKDHNQLDEIKNAIMSDRSFIPTYTENKASITSISEHKATLKSTYDPMNAMKTSLDKQITVGMKLAKLNWKVKGETFQTLCIYNEKGIVYDNILSNLFIIKADTTRYVQSTDASTNLKAASSFTGNIDVVLNWTTYWVIYPFSERGHATIHHIGYYINGKYDHQTFSHDEAMTLGTCGVGIKPYNNIRSISYAYYFATSIVTVSFSYTQSGGSVSVSGSLGSGASGGGAHAFSATH